ncbi:MAG: aldose 1-epimerase [Candidatus Azotimanducaceae bacterium]|jgi:aldose 1-epimerase
MSDSTIAPDGEEIVFATLTSPSGLTVRFMDWGATWLSCRVPVGTANRETLLQCSTVADHLAQSAYLGATVGRFANRIENAQFKIDQQLTNLDANAGQHSLHGGPLGFGNRRWKIHDQKDNAVTFQIESHHGDQGFPGNLTANACYSLNGDDTVSINFSATTDAATPVSLTNHAYFNLADGQAPALDHTAQIRADKFLPVDQHGIPVSGPLPVGETPFDFRKPRRIERPYDHAFVLHDKNISQPDVTLWGPDGTLRLDIVTDMPAVQLYTGNHLENENFAVNQPMSRHSGIAIETAFLPDAPNQNYADQPSCILRPGQTYDSRTDFRFRTT